MNRRKLPTARVTLADVAAAYPALAAVAKGTLSLPRLDPEHGTWLDGPATVKWLLRTCLDSTGELGGNTQHRLKRWADGESAHYDALDRILMARGLSLHDVPDGLWIRRPPPAPGKRFGGRAEREAAARRYMAGERATDLAREYGLKAPRTIRVWAKRLEEGHRL